MSMDDFGADDPVYRRFMERQIEEGLELAGASDILRLHVPPVAPPHFIAEYNCEGLVREDDTGELKQAKQFLIGIWMPQDYLRRADAFEMLRMITPRVWHPNISGDVPFICVGHITPGTSLVDLLYRCYDVLTYQKFNPREDDSLNKAACAWARQNQNRFPIDSRPLKRRTLSLGVKEL
jgi:hypothetical protein